jgi:hypothetical protein
MEDDMIGILKRGWWFGPFVVGFAVATIATVQATITIGGAVFQATSAQPVASQDSQLLAADVLNQLATAPKGGFDARLVVDPAAVRKH